MLAQRLRMPGPVDADHMAEPAGPTGLDADLGVLEDGAPLRRQAQLRSRRQERVRRGLARQLTLTRDHPVDAQLDERVEPGDLQDLFGVRAAGDHRPAQPGLA